MERLASAVTPGHMATVRREYQNPAAILARERLDFPRLSASLPVPEEKLADVWSRDNRQRLAVRRQVQSGRVIPLEFLLQNLCAAGNRSEERRVGKECRSRWS